MTTWQRFCSSRDKNLVLSAVLCASTLLSDAALATAGTKAEAIQETVEYVVKKFAKEAAETGADKLAAKTESLAVRYGDEVLTAVKATGPRGLKLIDDAGANGREAARLLAKFGDEAATVVARPSRLALVSKYGDDAAEAVIKHPGIAEPVVAAYGKAGAKAMSEVGAQNGRRIATMVDTGELAKLGRGEELLGVAGKYGDRGMDFIYRHRKVLAGGAVLTAFLANPQPYIDGTLELATLATDAVVKPLAETPQKVALKSLENPWIAGAFAVAAIAFFAALCYCLYRIFLRPRLLAARLAEERAANSSRVSR